VPRAALHLPEGFALVGVEHRADLGKPLRLQVEQLAEDLPGSSILFLHDGGVVAVQYRLVEI
jgi:hypothetical protein